MVPQRSELPGEPAATGPAGVSSAVLEGGGADEGPPSALADAVAELHRELEGLRRAARLRAVIEQAKGVFVERYGISLDEAFDRLRRLSQEHNVRLVEVSATLVGIKLPDDYGDDLVDPLPAPAVGESPAASPAWAALAEQPEVRAKTAAALFHGLSVSASDGDDAARVIKMLSDPLGADGVLLYRLAADGSLRLLGSDGIPADFVSGWRAVPPDIDVPVVRAVKSGEPVYLSGEAERRERFPVTASVRPTFVASASLPAVDPSGVLGVVVLVWTEERVFDDKARAQLEHLVRTSGPVLMRSARRTDPELAWLGTVLQILFDPWVLLDPVPGSSGEPVDFRVALAAPRLAESQDLIGRRIAELWPTLVESDLFQDLLRVERFGGVSEERLLTPGEPLPFADAGSKVRAVRLGPRVVLHWRAREF